MGNRKSGEEIKVESERDESSRSTDSQDVEGLTADVVGEGSFRDGSKFEG